MHFIADPASLADKLQPLVPVHGRKVIERWIAAAAAGDFETLVDELLVMHYDPTYGRSILRNFPRHAEAIRVAPARDRRAGVSRAGPRPRRPGQHVVRRRGMTMGQYDFRIVNVFAETPLGGNPLCVFEDARDLDDATMQALALQFNLSETTFVLPSANATARVRIFTPTFEMPFAGHPTLGTAHVVRDLMSAGDALTLRNEGRRHSGRRRTATSGRCRPMRPCSARPRRRASELAAMLGLDAGRPVRSARIVGEYRIRPAGHSRRDLCRRAPRGARADTLLAHGSNGQRAMAYVFAREGDHVLARFFFPKHGSVIEDPGTGSACANLGGWLLATGAALPQKLTIDQGEAVGRPCRLGLEVTAGPADPGLRARHRDRARHADDLANNGSLHVETARRVNRRAHFRVDGRTGGQARRLPTGCEPVERQWPHAYSDSLECRHWRRCARPQRWRARRPRRWATTTPATCSRAPDSARPTRKCASLPPCRAPTRLRVSCVTSRTAAVTPPPAFTSVAGPLRPPRS